jgi:tetratricopeptide (TPR) repeat protein
LTSDPTIADFNKAIELAPNSADYYCNRGLAYYYNDQIDLAIVDFNRVMNISTDSELVASAKKMLDILQQLKALK